MKKSLFSIIVILCCGVMFSACTKEGTPTIVPSMTATIGTSTFNAEYIEPSTVKSQVNDTGTTLIIEGSQLDTKEKIRLVVTKYTGKPGTFSIVQGQASAAYYHNGFWDVATGGIVSIKDASGNTINGYFSFTTYTNVGITNATFVCGRPWEY